MALVFDGELGSDTVRNLSGAEDEQTPLSGTGFANTLGVEGLSLNALVSVNILTDETSLANSLIVNGDFEDNPVNLDASGNGFGFFDAIEGWTPIFGQIEIQEGANSNSDLGVAGNGLLELATNQNAGVQQTVTVAEGAEGVHTLSLDHAQRNDDFSPAIFQVIVDGEVVATVTPERGTANTFTIDLDLAAGDHTIGLVEIGQNNGRGSLIDNVSLIATGAPLPPPPLEPQDLEISLADTQIAEDGSTIATITRTGEDGIDQPLTVTLDISGGDEAEAEFVEVTFAANQTSLDVAINGLTDGIVDGDQTVTVTATAGALEASAELTVTDIDEAPPPPEIEDDEAIVAADEASTIDVLANDGLVAGAVIGTLNGEAVSAGDVVTLESGALVTINTDGTIDYDPNGAFDNLAIGEAVDDTFEYQALTASSAAIGASGVIELSDLDGSSGFVLNGISGGDSSGFSVSNAGDVNGDGIDDVIIGAPLADPIAFQSAGESYVVFGTADGFNASFDLANLDGNNGFVLSGIDDFTGFNGNSGNSVASAGDINGDGIGDLIIGAPEANPSNILGVAGRILSAGQSYVVFGSTDGFDGNFNFADLDGNNGFVLSGINQSDETGDVVSSAGDINGDGIDDLVIGAFRADPDGIGGAGQSYVVFGSADGFDANLNLADLDGSNGFVLNGVDPLDDSGSSVSSAGDVNGDGIDDLIIGAPGGDPGNSAAGESYVVFGTADSFDASFSLADLDGSNGFVINGINANDSSGSSVSSAGDVNGDGIDDLIIGAPRGDPNGISSAGESYVVFGTADGFDASFNLGDLDGSNGFVINGMNFADFSGSSVSSAGDVNGDGIDDLIIGAPEARPNGTSSGETYIVFGSTDAFDANLNLSDLDGSNGFVLNGFNIGGQSGSSVSGAGDVNGDGIDDLIIGAFRAGPDGLGGAGQSFIVFGSADIAEQLSGPATVTVTVIGTNDTAPPPPQPSNNLIVNGDFEDNPVNLDANGNGFGFFGSIEGWTPIFGQIEIQEGANSNSDLGVAGNGVLELATNQNVGVEQTVTVADGAEGVYTLSLDHAQRNDDFSPAIFQVIVDGEIVATVTPERGTSNTFTIDLDLDAGDHTIGLVEIGQNNGRGSLIDNVSLVASNAPPPPPAFVDTNGIDNVVGTDGDDTLVLIGDGFVDTFDAGAGNDTLDLTAFSNGVSVSLNNDSALESNSGPANTVLGFENILAGSGSDSLNGDDAENIIEAGGGNDLINGGGGADTLLGGDGDDVFFEADFTISLDTIDGGAGTDLLVLEPGPGFAFQVDLAAGTAFVDAAQTTQFTNIENITTGFASDTVVGSNEDNSISTGGGDDIIDGGAGNDTIRGGSGNDQITGGSGVDTIIFSTFNLNGSNVNTITDISEEDRLELGFMGNLTLLGTDAFTAAGNEIRVEADNGSTVISFDIDGDQLVDTVIELTNGEFNLQDLGDSLFGVSSLTTPPPPPPPPPEPGVDLIVNGDFEDNPVNLDANGNGFGFFDEIEGFASTLGQIEIQEGANSNSDLAAIGNGLLELASNQNSGVEQTVTVADGAEGVHTLSLDHAQRNDDFSPAIFQVIVDGEVVATVTPERGTANTFTIDLDLAAGDHTIGLVEIGQNNGRGSLIDNVSLVATGAPLPPPPLDPQGLEISLANTQIAEDGSTIATITRTGEDGIDEPLTVTLDISGGNEAEAEFAEVTFAANQTSLDVAINGLTDGVVDGDQSVTVTASSGTLTGTTNLIVTDIDFAPPPPPPPEPGVDLIVNGDFENNPVNLDANGNGFGFFDEIEGFTSTLGQIEIQEGANGNSNLAAAGNGLLELASNQNSGVEQIVTVADGAEGVYTLSLDHAQRNDDFTPAIFNVIVDGEVVATVTPERGTSSTFEIDLDLDAGNHTIGFEEVGVNNGRGSLIDNVSLVSTGAPLPEPEPEPEPTGSETLSFAGEAGGRFVNLETGETSVPLRVLPLGDSITFGIEVAPRDNGDSTLGGYRDDLFESLLGNGILIDYVGSQTTGPSTLLDQAHEGTPGIRADMLAPILQGQVAQFDPDIVLLMAGTNDSRQDPVNSGQTTPQDLLGLINIVLNQNPDAQIFVSTLIPQEPDGGRNSAALPAVAEANVGIVQLVADLNSAGFNNIHLVDNSDLPLSLISDLGPGNINDVGVHPTDAGYAEIARRWFDALNNVFDGLPGGLSGTPSSVDTAVQNIVGANGNDLLIGNSASNEIDGGAGNDVLNGGGGNDTLAGGSGRDIFVTSQGNDRITDFGVGTDFIDLGSSGISNLSQLLNSASDTSAGASISVGNGSSILVEGVAIGQLNNDSFIFDDAASSFSASATTIIAEEEATQPASIASENEAFEFVSTRLNPIETVEPFTIDLSSEDVFGGTADGFEAASEELDLFDQSINGEVSTSWVDDFFL